MNSFTTRSAFLCGTIVASLLSASGCSKGEITQLRPQVAVNSVTLVTSLSPIGGQTGLYTVGGGGDVFTRATNQQSQPETFCTGEVTWSTDSPNLIDIVVHDGVNNCTLTTSNATITAKGITGTAILYARTSTGVTASAAISVITPPTRVTITSTHAPASFPKPDNYTFSATVGDCASDCAVQWYSGATTTNMALEKVETNVSSTSFSPFLPIGSGWVRLVVFRVSSGQGEEHFFQYNIVYPVTTVSISGSSYLPGFTACNWSVSASGAVAPYTYSWTIGGYNSAGMSLGTFAPASGAGQSFTSELYANVSYGTGTLTVTATDANGVKTVGTKSFTVGIGGGC